MSVLVSTLAHTYMTMYVGSLTKVCTQTDERIRLGTALDVAMDADVDMHIDIDPRFSHKLSNIHKHVHVHGRALVHARVYIQICTVFLFQGWRSGQGTPGILLPPR